MSALNVKSSPVTVCTLWQLDFHKGVGTLVNSLAQAGYQGKVWAGYRGTVPSWAGQADADAPQHSFHTGTGVEIVFVKIATDLHFTQYKAQWMSHILSTLDPTAEGIYYFDPDIFVLAGWHFFEDWLNYGIAACEDVEFPLNPTHPLVHRWCKYARTLGYSFSREMNAYLNGGLIGVSREHASFLTLWEELMQSTRRDFNIGSRLRMDTRTDLFYGTDQDAFTLASVITPHPLSWVGPDGMAFERGEWLTVHVYQRKPWRRRVFRDLLREGEKPDFRSRLYWRFAAGPIPMESASRVRRHRFFLPLGAFLSRFYQRIGK